MLKTKKKKWPYLRIKINGKWILEHRYKIEQHLGRKLETWEFVHHINEDPMDNRIENLEIKTPSEHAKLHKLPKFTECVCESCGEEYLIKPSIYRFKLKVGQHFFCSKKCIGKFGFNSRYGRSNVLRPRIRKFLKSGLTGYAISKRLKIPRSIIYWHIKKMGP